jgi:homopolymeric O-antigen transport system permease protein
MAHDERIATADVTGFVQGAEPVWPASDVVTVIRPTRGPIPPRVNELWRYRELFLFLVWRDVKVRYAQTVLGALWMVFQPMAMMLVYTFAFSHLTHVAVRLGVPYPIFALSGLVLWIFVSRGVLMGAESLVVNMPLVTKTSCPRILLPAAAVTSVLADFVVTIVLYLVFAGAYGTLPDWHIVFVPLLLLLAFVLALGLALFLSATNVRYRDVSQALPFLIQLWFFLSPVAYLLQTPGHSWETAVQGLNPLVGIILAMRWALLGGAAPHGLFVVACVVTFLVFALGVVRFAHAERTIADEL